MINPLEGLGKRIKRYYHRIPTLEDLKRSDRVKSNEDNLIGFKRVLEERIQPIYSDNNRLTSNRWINPSCVLLGNWSPNRIMEIIPLTIDDLEFLSVKKSSEYELLPDYLKEVFDSNKLLRTCDDFGKTYVVEEVNTSCSMYNDTFRTIDDLISFNGVTRNVSYSPSAEASNFSVLMSVLESDPPQGRTGVLLHDNEPVIINLNNKDFIIEIKGVGCPNGDNGIKELMTRSSYFGQGRAKWGGLEPEQAEREFRNLELIKGSLTSQQGDAPIPLLCAEYDSGVDYYEGKTSQGYIVRLTPSSIRASFNNNEKLPVIRNKPLLIAQSLGEQLTEYLDLGLIHTCAHAENLLLTNNGFKLTDFSDMRLLSELDNPREIVEKSLVNYIKEIPGSNDECVEVYAKTICDKLGLEWIDDYKNLSDLASIVYKSVIKK